MGIATAHLEVLMKKLFPALHATLRFLGRNKRLSDGTTIANVLKRMFSIVALFTAGCAAEEAHWDSAKLRQHAMTYYTDQIIDNLIRARNGQFFLHVNINNLQAQVISEVAGTVQGGQTLNNTNSRQTTNEIVRTNTNTPGAALSNVVAGTVGVVGTAMNLAVRPLTFSVTPRLNDQLNFGTVPEVNDPLIYAAYLKFLNAEPNQRLGKIGTYEPIFGDAIKSVRRKQPRDTLVEGAPGEYDSLVLGAHTHYYVPGTLKKWNDGQIYYVPIAFSRAYFELCLELAGRITIGPKTKESEAKGLPAGLNALPSKPESPGQDQLKRIEQKLNSLPQQQ
jgi:hypothetical protein